MTDPLDRPFAPADIEADCYQRWLDLDLFSPQGEGEPYCIMLPPPNVTGTLHMGHAFQDTLMDILIRRARMQGKRTLWQPGTDHAGIATQMLVERRLETQGESRHDLGRSAFLERVWAWKEESGGRISQQMRRLGASCDWKRERFTLDEGLSQAVAEVFVRLHQEGLIYRGKRLVNWDPVLQTAVSDLEVLSSEEEGRLWHIAYPLEDGSAELVVATTRPETLLGDVAVALAWSTSSPPMPESDRKRRSMDRTPGVPFQASYRGWNAIKPASGFLHCWNPKGICAKAIPTV